MITLWGRQIGYHLHLKWLKEEVCPNDGKNSETQQVYRPKSFDPLFQGSFQYVPAPWKASLTWNSWQEGCLAHLEWWHWLSAGCWVQCPRSVHWETAGWSCHNSSAYGRRCHTPSGAHSPALSYGASGDYNENRKGTQGMKLAFFPSFLLLNLLSYIPPTSLFHFPRVCFILAYGFWKTCCDLSPLTCPVCAVSLSPSIKKGPGYPYGEK